MPHLTLTANIFHSMKQQSIQNSTWMGYVIFNHVQVLIPHGAKENDIVQFSCDNDLKKWQIVDGVVANKVDLDRQAEAIAMTFAADRSKDLLLSQCRKSTVASRKRPRATQSEESFEDKDDIDGFTIVATKTKTSAF